LLQVSSDIPTSAIEVLLWPLIFSILGLIVWYIGLRVEFNTEKSAVKWLAFVPLGIATYLGGAAALRTTDYAYQELMDRKMTLYGHYIALALPLIAIGALLTWNWYQKRQTAQNTF
jgi:hypothetical protein